MHSIEIPVHGVTVVSAEKFEIILVERMNPDTYVTCLGKPSEELQRFSFRVGDALGALHRAQVRAAAEGAANA
jgi:hypothetical protein